MSKKAKLPERHAITPTGELLRLLKDDLVGALAAVVAIQHHFKMIRLHGGKYKADTYSDRCELTHRLGRISGLTHCLFMREEADYPNEGISRFKHLLCASDGVFMMHTELKK